MLENLGALCTLAAQTIRVLSQQQKESKLRGRGASNRSESYRESCAQNEIQEEQPSKHRETRTPARTKEPMTHTADGFQCTKTHETLCHHDN